MVLGHKTVTFKHILPVTLPGPVAKVTKGKLKKKNSEKVLVFLAWLQRQGQ